jgi:hypothetical protein
VGQFTDSQTHLVVTREAREVPLRLVGLDCRLSKLVVITDPVKAEEAATGPIAVSAEAESAVGLPALASPAAGEKEVKGDD